MRTLAHLALLAPLAALCLLLAQPAHAEPPPPQPDPPEVVAELQKALDRFEVRVLLPAGDR